MKRSRLYELAWRKPMHKLAPELGLSDTGLKKVCLRHNIPVPQRGYWAKLAVGLEVVRMALPPGPDEEIPPFGNQRIVASEECLAKLQHLLTGSMTFAAEASAADDRGELQEANSEQQPRPAPLDDETESPPAGQAAGPEAMPPLLHDPPRVGARQPSGRNKVRGPSKASPDRVRDSDLGEALGAELQRAMVAADLMQRHETVQRFLSAVAMRAAREHPDDALVIQAWVTAIRRHMDAEGPVEQVVAELREDASAARRVQRFAR